MMATRVIMVELMTIKTKHCKEIALKMGMGRPRPGP
jgi:hypothetical protein